MRILCRIFYHEDFSAADGVIAESVLSWDLICSDAHFRFQPLTMLVDQADGAHGCATDVRGQTGQFVKFNLGLCVEQL